MCVALDAILVPWAGKVITPQLYKGWDMMFRCSGSPEEGHTLPGTQWPWNNIEIQRKVSDGGNTVQREEVKPTYLTMAEGRGMSRHPAAGPAVLVSHSPTGLASPRLLPLATMECPIAAHHLLL